MTLENGWTQRDETHENKAKPLSREPACSRFHRPMRPGERTVASPPGQLWSVFTVSRSFPVLTNHVSTPITTCLWNGKMNGFVLALDVFPHLCITIIDIGEFHWLSVSWDTLQNVVNRVYLVKRLWITLTGSVRITKSFYFDATVSPELLLIDSTAWATFL